jgi:hypothetical protein
MNVKFSYLSSKEMTENFVVVVTEKYQSQPQILSTMWVSEIPQVGKTAIVQGEEGSFIVLEVSPREVLLCRI